MADGVTPAAQQQLLNEAIALLKGTTVGFAGHSAAWRANQTTKWWQALDRIQRVREDLNPTPPGPPAPSGITLGASTHYRWMGAADIEPRARKLKQEGGITWLREDFDWARAQPSKGGPFNWSQSDAVMTGAAQAGISGVLAIASYHANWPNWTDTEYAAYCKAIVDRYNTGTIRLALSFWNEPYMPASYLPPDRYARLCRTASAAVRPTSVTLMADVDTGDYQTGRQDAYFQTMLATVPDLAQHLDAWSLHPYNGRYGPNDATNPDGIQWRFDRVKHFQTVAASKNATLPVWITEAGWSTATGEVSEQQQAIFTADAIRLARSWGVPMFMVYTGSYDGTSDDKLSRYGMLRADGSAKPVLAALKAL